MRTAALVRAVALASLTAVACGPVTHSSTASTGRTTAVVTASAARTQSPCPAVQPALPFGAATSSSRNLALVTLGSSAHVVVRDITDIDHPATVTDVATSSNGGEFLVPQFVSSTELSYLDLSGSDPNGGLLRMTLDGKVRSLVASGCDNIFNFAWSPDGSSAIYTTDATSGSELHLVSGGSDRVLSYMPGMPITGCERPGCGEQLDSRLLYSPDGRFISMVQSWGGPTLRIWTSSGLLLKSIDSRIGPYPLWPNMSAWSGRSLYYRDAAGVEGWHDGTLSLLLPGLQWIRPRASPAGGQIVYAARDAAGSPHVYLVDTSSRSVRELKKDRNGAVFLTPRYIWYWGERLCTSTEFCGDLTTTGTGKTYIYDLQTGTESESIITNVFDVWPHPA